jgi:1-acyl-sn-glycerol-3-phosphate acyltransferase
VIASATEPLRLLSRTERAGLWLAELCARRFPFLAVAFSFFPMGALVWLGIGRRLRLSGLENVRSLPRDSSLLLVANHRSFFDFFTVVVTLRFKAGFRHHIYFPVRSEFFYDHLVGILVNLVAAGMSMFPPIFRFGPKRALNVWSLTRCAELLAKPGTAVGFHPEGTRNKGPDPFRLQPAHAGLGRVAIAAPQARVIPVFVAGLGNRIPTEIRHNLTAPRRYPVWMAFGPEVDLADLRERGNRATAQEAADRCRGAIQLLADAVAVLARQADQPIGGGSPAAGHADREP